MKIKVGDKLPSSELFYLDQNNEVKKIDILSLCKNNKTIILGMPGAFTKTCSAIHLPGYIKNYDLASEKGVQKIVCIAVNDPNVMKAWLEILGCGMVDPEVYKSVKYNSEEWSGYAFGMGIERIAMLKYGVKDIRLFYEGDIRFLGQFA